MKYKLGCKYYGRYVDDIVIVHKDKEYLKLIIPIVRDYLKDNLFLELHPSKIYLQHFSKGVRFLGVFIKPYRIYIGDQTKGSFYKKTKGWNKFLINNHTIDKKALEKFVSSENSYLGIFKHYSTYHLRKGTMEKRLSPDFLKYVSLSNDYDKILYAKKHKESDK